MNDDTDLRNLVDEASAEVEADFQSALSAKPKPSIRWRLGPLLPVALLGLAAYIYFSQQPQLPDSVAIAASLTELVEQARTAVEANVVDGQYPPVLPNAALGAVVNYQIFNDGRGYFLSAQSNSVVVEMDNTGVISVMGVN